MFPALLRRTGAHMILAFSPFCRFATSSSFPHRIVPLFVGREKSVAALEAAMAADKELFLVAQLDPGEDDPDRDALYDLGVDRDRDAAPQAARRHGSRAGRGRQARAARRSRRRATAITAAEIEEVDEEDRRGTRSPGADALGDRPVRKLREAQQAPAARNRDPARRDRGALGACRCGRVEPVDQGRRQAGAARRAQSRRAGSRWCSPSWKASSACSRSRRRSAAASSGRWRRRSANII